MESNTVASLAEGTTIIPFRLLGAIVAPARWGRVPVNEEELADYTRILEEVQKTTAVLPAPPGTVFRTRDSLARWLELHYFTLTQAIGVVEGHSEARVTITQSPSPDSNDATAGEIKERTKQLAAVASNSMRVLRGQATATITLPVSEEDTTVVAQASFLVDMERWAMFCELVAKEDQRHTDLDFRLSGPWPPYDFVRMEFGG